VTRLFLLRPFGGLLFRFRLEENNFDRNRVLVVLGFNAKWQLAFGQAGLMISRAYVHHVKRGLRRAPVKFREGIRLLQKFQHFNLGSHTLSRVFLTAVHVPLKESLTTTIQRNDSKEIPLGTSVRICLACRV